MSLTQIIVEPDSGALSFEHENPTILVLWDQAIQAALAELSSDPTIARRAYEMVHTSIYEAWAAYDPIAIGTVYMVGLQVDSSLINEANKMEAMSYAAYVAAMELFPYQQEIFDQLMADLGYSSDLDDLLSDASVLGIKAAEAVIANSVFDGSNQKNDYADTSGYTLVNTESDSAIELDSWTPTYVSINSDGPETLQQFLTPHWPQIIVDQYSGGLSVENENPTISVLWDQAIQAAVIQESPGPTIASRAYAIVHSSIYEAWAAYDPIAIGTAYLDGLQVDTNLINDANKMEAMSYAAYVAALDLFPDQHEIFDKLLGDLGYSYNLEGVLSDAAVLGIMAAEAVLADRVNDGSNQANDYAATSAYTPVNTDPDSVVELDRWTPTYVPIDSGGPETLQQFLTPHWGDVTPFALDNGGELRPVAPEPFFNSFLDASIDMASKTITLHGLSDSATQQELQTLKQQLFDLYEHTASFDDVKNFIKAAKTHIRTGEPQDTELILDVSKSLIGPVVNPGFIKQAEDIVAASAALTQEQKVIAEFWEDGGGTAFPPGTWMTFGQFVSARDEHSLDDDAQLFFALANAVMDAGIATWEAKVFYDYARPVSAIRDLGHLGLIGEFDENFGGYVITAYAGEDFGVTQILATDFITYQNLEADPSPPFAEYTSGHSSFSAAGAEVLKLFTGSEDFGASVEIDFFLFEEQSPDAPVILEWDTFDEAADEAGLSRIYGGIHFDDGDINGRILGEEVGAAVFELAQTYIDGTADNTINDFNISEGDTFAFFTAGGVEFDAYSMGITEESLQMNNSVEDSISILIEGSNLTLEDLSDPIFMV